MSYLQFTDGMILLLSYDHAIFYNVTIILHFLQIISSLCINLRKSRLVGINIDHQRIKDLTESRGFDVLDWSFILLGGNPKVVFFWDLVFPFIKIPEHLDRWKEALFPLGGKATLKHLR